jgi:DNA-binding NarL/FixJ family response regulator
VIDEAGIMRDGLCALLESDPTIEVIAASANRRDVVQELDIVQPHVIIMDFSTDLKGGPETIALLKRRWPEVRVLVLTVRRDEQFIETALRAGADGYVLKSDSRVELFNAVHRIASGKGYISPSALDRMVTAYAKTSDRLPGRPRPPGALTQREQEVIALIAKGYRTREMAELMSLSHKTVEKHRTNLMRKLGLRSAAAVAAYAITHGFA